MSTLSKNHRPRFNSRPHEEVDVHAHQSLEPIRFRFNSRPHEEVDVLRESAACNTIVSTHDLTRRSTIIHYSSLPTVMFQLTTSRGGRPSAAKRKRNVRCFNSRPHEEVDCSVYCWVCTSSVSTHDLTRRSTLFNIQNGCVQFCFNSRPHEEVDVVVPSNADASKVFQLTTSRGGRQQFLRKKFSFQNHFLCSLHIIYSYYINIVFFSTLFLAKFSFFLVRIP